MTKILTLPTEEHLETLAADLEGRWDNARDDGDDTAALDAAIEWLSGQIKDPAFPLTLNLTAAPEAVAAEIATSVENLGDYDIDLALAITEADADATGADWLGHPLYEGDWLAFVRQRSVKQMRVGDALAIAHQALRRLRDAAEGDERDNLVAACGVIQGLRAQRGCEEVTEDGVEYLTHLCDIIIFG